MTKCNVRDLKEAACAITSDSLDAAKKAIIIECSEYISWAGLMRPKIEGIACASDKKKLARALTLTMLGHLPTKPITCPFCIQYSGDKTCKGCGYALTHGGRCDEDTSAFSCFIEAFQELGKAVLQDQDDGKILLDNQIRLDGEILLDLEQGKQMLREFIDCSIGKARQILEDLPAASTDQLMEVKALYLDQMICLIPLRFFSHPVRNKHKKVREALKDYW